MAEQAQQNSLSPRRAPYVSVLPEQAAAPVAVPLSPTDEISDEPIGATQAQPLQESDTFLSGGTGVTVKPLEETDEIQAQAVDPGFPSAMPAIGVAAPAVAATQAASLLALKYQEHREETIEAENKAINASLPDYMKFDPESDFTGGLMGLLVQADLARNESVANKQKKFMSHFPDGQLIAVPGENGPILLARENKTEPFRKLRTAPEVLGSVVSEPTVLGTLGSFVSWVGTGVGTGVGEIAQNQIESARGYPEAGAGIGSAIGSGAEAAALDLTLRGAGRLLLGRKVAVSEKQALDRAYKVADELNLEPLTVGQTSTKFFRKMFHQVGIVGSRVERVLTNQQTTLLARFREMGDNIPQGTPNEMLEEIIRAQHKELASVLNIQALRRPDAGDALQKGIETYRKASARLRDRYYRQAVDLSEDVTFNLAPAQVVANEIRTGVLGRAAQTRNELGQFDPAELIRINESPNAQLSRVLDDLALLNPKVQTVKSADGTWTAFEQIKSLRTRLFDLMQASDGSTRRDATKLWQSLTEVMDNPVSANPDFVAAYQKASGFNRLREQTLELSYVASALRTDTSEALAKKYFAPGNSQALATIKAIVPRPRWEEFRQSFQLDLANMATAQRAINRLQTFRAVDPSGLRQLMSEQEERSLVQYLTKRAQFEASPAQKLLNRTMTDGESFVQFAKAGTAGDVAEAVRLAGGPSSRYAQAAKAGVYKDILDQSIDITPQGIEVVSTQKMQQAVQEWLKSGKLNSIMTPDEVARVADLNAYAAIVSETGDIGGGMMRGQMAQQFIEFGPLMAAGKFAKAHMLGRKWVGNKMMAYLLSRRAYAGRVRPEHGLPFRETTIALDIAAHQLEQSESEQ